MNNTFDFERDYPDLYAEVQAAKAKTKRAERIALLLTIAINLFVVSVLINHGVSVLIQGLIIGWTSFSSVFALRPLLEYFMS